MRRLLAALPVCAGLACADAPAPSFYPPGLAEHPEVRGELIYREDYRWYHFGLDLTSAQWAELYRDGDELIMLRWGVDGRVHGWAIGRMTADALALVDEALVEADPSLGEPDDCTWKDTNPAIIYFEDQEFDYWTLCAPPGFEALAQMYSELNGQAVACPLWLDEYLGEPGFVPRFDELECEADEEWEF